MTKFVGRVRPSIVAATGVLIAASIIAPGVSAGGEATTYWIAEGSKKNSRISFAVTETAARHILYTPGRAECSDGSSIHIFKEFGRAKLRKGEFNRYQVNEDRQGRLHGIFFVNGRVDGDRISGDMYAGIRRQGRQCLSKVATFQAEEVSLEEWEDFRAPR